MMKRIHLLLLFLVLSSAVSAQFNENAPWLQDAVNKRVASKNPYTLDELNKSFENYFKDKDRDAKGSGFKPYMRWMNHWKHYVTQDGTIAKPELLWNAWQQKESIAQKFNNVSAWKTIGPFTTTTKTGQGRVNTFTVDPNHPNIFYVGAPSGGIWKSTDYGVNWEPLSDGLPQIGVSAIAIDPNDSDTIYIATGDDDAGDTYSTGVMKSTDGGKTWSNTGLTFTGTWSRISELYAHPSDSKILWTATSRGFYKTEDSGKTWKRKLSGNIRDMKLKPGDPNTIYAVTSSDFYRSTDGGNSFTRIESELPETGTASRMAIEVTRANPSIVYVLSANKSNSFQGVYRSFNSGQTFTKTLEIRDIFGGSTQAWYDMSLTVSPVDEDVVFVGVLDIWKSTDGGDKFTQINRWWNPTEPAYTHADIHFLRYYNGKLYAGTDGGIYESSDHGASFKDLSENLSISQYYKIATARNSSQNIAGGLQDNGGFAFSNNIWHRYHGGDGMDCGINPVDQEVFYGFTQYGSSLNVTYDAGKTEGGTIVEAPDAETNGSSDRGGNWVTPLAINKEGVIYGGYKKVYKLENSLWVAVTATAFEDDLDNLEISDINPDLMYASVGQKLFKSTDGGKNFNVVKDDFRNSITSIEINNSNTDIVYVTLGGFNSNGVFKSTDGGNSWTEITYNLPGEPKFIIKHQNQSPDNDLYLGTSLGVYHINDQMSEWEVFSNNLPNVPVKDLEINVDEQTITAGTYGRGVWQSPIEVKKAAYDVSLVKFNNHNTITCGSITPEILVKNNGLNTINSVSVAYSIDDVDYNYTFSGNIGSDKEQIIELPQVNELEIGNHSISIQTSVSNDAFEDNNTLTGSFVVNNSSEGKYINTFGDVNADDWIVQTKGSAVQLWQKGTASSSKFRDLSDNAYITNPSGNYTDQTVSYLISPCYNLSKMENPVLKFDMAFDIELEWDVLYMEYTTDAGKTWQILGSANDPNWYNSSFKDPERPITVGKQWTGTQPQLKNYSYDLSALKDAENIIFRFVFASDQAENGEGAIIDNFTIAATAILATNDFEKTHFNLFPNPSDGTFYIQREDTEPLQISVYDITGKLVYKRKNIAESRFEIRLNKAAKGLYFMKIEQNGKQAFKRLLLK